MLHIPRISTYPSQEGNYDAYIDPFVYCMTGHYLSPVPSRFLRWMRFRIGLSKPPCHVNDAALHKSSNDEGGYHSSIEEVPNCYPPKHISLGGIICLTVCNGYNYT